MSTLWRRIENSEKGGFLSAIVSEMWLPRVCRKKEYEFISEDRKDEDGSANDS